MCVRCLFLQDCQMYVLIAQVWRRAQLQFTNDLGEWCKPTQILLSSTEI